MGTRTINQRGVLDKVNIEANMIPGQNIEITLYAPVRSFCWKKIWCSKKNLKHIFLIVKWEASEKYAI